MSKIEVLSYGEALVDFLPNKSGKLRSVDSFRRVSGGAPANMAIGIARLGRKVGLMGNVGADEFGHFLIEELQRQGVDTSGVHQTNLARTGITFVSLDEKGERSFLFFRAPSADMLFQVENIRVETIEACSIFIAGSNLLITPEIAHTTFSALNHAKRLEKFIIIDPNVRLHLWEDLDHARTIIHRLLTYADIVKLNDDEIEFLAPGADAKTLYETVLRPAGVSALIATRAERGAEVFAQDAYFSVQAPDVKVVDTTGAGDGFVAGMVSGLVRFMAKDSPLSPERLRARVPEFGDSEWTRILNLGCWVGSRVCTQLGATSALPAHDEVPWHDLGFET